jgi:hypothetical protein
LNFYKHAPFKRAGYIPTKWIMTKFRRPKSD